MSEEVSNSPEREPKQKVESLRVFVRVRPKLRNETVKEDAAFAGTNVYIGSFIYIGDWYKDS